MIYGHGDDGYNFSHIRANFSSNVNPKGINNGLRMHLINCIGSLDTYPDPMAETLSAQIEQEKKLPAGSVLVTNGAVEAFYLIAALHKNNNTLIYTPSFAEYEDACHMYNHSIEFRHNAIFPPKNTKGFDSVWICNPNNPDGKIIEPQILRKIISENPKTCFVVDEAYAEFTTLHTSLKTEAPSFQNLVITRSLTKRFSIPGLRLGYLVSSPAIVKRLKTLLMPWRINTMALQAGQYCFSSKYTDNFNLSELLNESQRLQTQINNIDGFSVTPSITSFFLVKAPVEASVLKQKLSEKYGILIRDASNFRGLSKNHFRISTQSPLNNNDLIKALKSWR